MLFSMDVKEDLNLDSLPIVREFPKIFPKDVPSLPSQRELVFAIDLVPGTSYDKEQLSVTQD